MSEKKCNCNEPYDSERFEGGYPRCPVHDKPLDVTVIGHGKPEQHPGSGYQDLFDYISHNHGISLLTSEMDDLVQMVHKFHPQNPAGGNVWVKASEFKTSESIYRPYRRKREDGDPEYDYGEIYATEDNGKVFLDIDGQRIYEPQSFERWKDYEILNESPNEQPVEQKESEAVDADELWDEHSALIGDDIDDLSYWAGREVMKKEDFIKAIDEYQKQNKR